MKYKLRNLYSIEPQLALQDILIDRGVENIETFLHPNKATCELNPYDLDNIKAGAEKLLYHLRRNSAILFNVD